MDTNRDTFLGLRQLPTCDHEPQVILDTPQLCCCLDCAVSCMRELLPLVNVLIFVTGGLSDYGQAILKRTSATIQSESREKPIQSGGNQSY